MGEGEGVVGFKTLALDNNSERRLTVYGIRL